MPTNNTNVDPNVAKIAFGRAIPGQSWATHAPKSTPYQKPPQFTDLEETMNWLMDQITEPQHLKELLNLMDGGMSVEAVARTILFSGFTMGKWTVSLMMLMHKPLMLSLAVIAHRAGLKHTPMVLKERFDKYHTSKMKKFMVTNQAKDQAEISAEAPTTAPTEPQMPTTGFMNRPS